MSNSTDRRAIFSLITGILVVTIIPVISFLIAPCGFPLSLISGITAVVLGRRSLKEPAASINSQKMARAGVICGWVGMVLNTIIMLIKLAMFIALAGLVIGGIFGITNSK
jgi:hypothetical protein